MSTGLKIKKEYQNFKKNPPHALCIQF
jgi:hypothetical protein